MLNKVKWDIVKLFVLLIIGNLMLAIAFAAIVTFPIFLFEKLIGG